ncbi:MAG: DUF3137 domain-containing protein [Prolixibacteraceae bacterium]
MNQENLHHFYKTELLPSLKVFNRKRLILFPLVFLQSILAISVFMIIVTNVFNGFIGSNLTGFYWNGAVLFLFFFMTLLGYSLLKSYRLYFPRLFGNKRLVLFLSVMLATLLFAGVALLKNTPVVFMHLDFNKKVEFGDFFSMFGAFLGLFGFTLIVLLPLSLLKARLNKQFTDQFKPFVNSKLITFINPAYSYSPEKSMELQVVNDSQLFAGFPDFTCLSEDLTEGEAGNHQFLFSTIIVRSDHQSGNQSDPMDLFSGLLFKTGINKKFNGHTFVRPDYAENILGRLGRGLQKMSLDETKLVQMEHPEFEKYFVVKSTDQVEARYLLTPSLIEKLLNARINFGRDFELSFASGNLYIALSLEKDFMSPSYAGPLISYRKIAEYCKGLELLIQLAVDLNHK